MVTMTMTMMMTMMMMKKLIEKCFPLSSSLRHIKYSISYENVRSFRTETFGKGATFLRILDELFVRS